MLSSLESLPPELMANIVTQMATEIGNKKIVNNADISVIMKSVVNLARTCRTMYNSINSPEFIDPFLQGLSLRFSDIPEEFAAQLDTRGARERVWKYIIENQLDKVHQAIYDISAIVSDVLEEATLNKINFKILGLRDSPKIKSNFFQTRNGLLLNIYGHPHHLATPFGEINLIGACSFEGMAQSSISECFLKRIDAVFEKISYYEMDKKYVEIYELPALNNDVDGIRKIDKNRLKKINIQEISLKRGTRNFINCVNGSSIYKVIQVKGTVLPEVVSSEEIRKKWYSPMLAMKMWEMLERNKLKLDPIDRIEPSKSLVPTIVPFLNNMSEVTPWAISLVKQLLQQPIFQGKFERMNQALKIKNSDELDIFNWLNNRMNQFFSQGNKWYINTFDFTTFIQVEDPNYKSQGLLLHIYPDVLIDFEALTNAYDSVLENLKTGWVKSYFDNYPDMYSIESEEEYVLFVKKESFPSDNCTLISLLAKQLGVDNCINCNDLWKNVDYLSNLSFPRTKYLWIKKEKVEEVINKLELKVSE